MSTYTVTNPTITMKPVEQQDWLAVDASRLVIQPLHYTLTNLTISISPWMRRELGLHCPPRNLGRSAAQQAYRLRESRRRWGGEE